MAVLQVDCMHSWFNGDGLSLTYIFHFVLKCIYCDFLPLYSLMRRIYISCTFKKIDKWSEFFEPAWQISGQCI